jgi:hypothetical protein
MMTLRLLQSFPAHDAAKHDSSCLGTTAAHPNNGEGLFPRSRATGAGQ